MLRCWTLETYAKFIGLFVCTLTGRLGQLRRGDPSVDRLQQLVPLGDGLDARRVSLRIDHRRGGHQGILGGPKRMSFPRLFLKMLL
jgi:hypothetical protein